MEEFYDVTDKEEQDEYLEEISKGLGYAIVPEYRWESIVSKIDSHKIKASDFQDMFDSFNINAKRNPIAENDYHLNQQDDYEITECLIRQLNGTNIDYRDWIRMGFALKNKFGNSGLTLWLLFADNYAYKDTVPELTIKWNTFPAYNSVKFRTFLYLTNNYITNNKIITGVKNAS